MWPPAGPRPPGCFATSCSDSHDGTQIWILRERDRGRAVVPGGHDEAKRGWVIGECERGRQHVACAAARGVAQLSRSFGNFSRQGAAYATHYLILNCLQRRPALAGPCPTEQPLAHQLRVCSSVDRQIQMMKMAAMQAQGWRVYSGSHLIMSVRVKNHRITHGLHRQTR